MKRVFLESLRWVARRMGYNVQRYKLSIDRTAVRGKLLTDLGVDLVLDVGANIGQYGSDLRAGGYKGRIISFEPVSEAYEQLRRATEADANWECRRLAIGDRDGTVEISVNNFTYTSSLLPMNQRLHEMAPQFQKVRDETVNIARLDTLWPELTRGAFRVFLKLDVQGYELSVLDGACVCVRQVVAAEFEMALAPLYEGQALFREMIDRVDDLGFDCFHFSQGTADDSSGRLLEIDSLLIRRDIAPAPASCPATVGVEASPR